VWVSSEHPGTAALKAMFRRVRRIEMQLAPRVNLPSQLVAQLVWERRRRRAEARGERFGEPPPQTRPVPPRGYPSVAETLRRRRRLPLEDAGVHIEIASDITS
jgi:hypothetical protein